MSRFWLLAVLDEFVAVIILTALAALSRVFVTAAFPVSALAGGALLFSHDAQAKFGGLLVAMAHLSPQVCKDSRGLEIVTCVFTGTVAVIIVVAVLAAFFRLPGKVRKWILIAFALFILSGVVFG